MKVGLRAWRIAAVAAAVAAAVGVAVYWSWYLAEGYMLYTIYPTAFAQYLAIPVLAHALAFAVFSLPAFGGVRDPVRKPLLVVSLALWFAYLAWFALYLFVTMAAGAGIADPSGLWYAFTVQSYLVVYRLVPWVPLFLGVLSGLAAKR